MFDINDLLYDPTIGKLQPLSPAEDEAKESSPAKVGTPKLTPEQKKRDEENNEIRKTEREKHIAEQLEVQKKAREKANPSAKAAAAKLLFTENKSVAGSAHTTLEPTNKPSTTANSRTWIDFLYNIFGTLLSTRITTTILPEKMVYEGTSKLIASAVKRNDPKTVIDLLKNSKMIDIDCYLETEALTKAIIENKHQVVSIILENSKDQSRLLHLMPFDIRTVFTILEKSENKAFKDIAQSYTTVYHQTSTPKPNIIVGDSLRDIATSTTAHNTPVR